MKSKTIRMVSLDAATQKTGFAYWENGCLKECGLIDHHKVKDKEEKFDLMCQSIIELLKKKNPHIVAIETPPFRKNPQTLKKLSKLTGLVLGYCLTKDCDYVELMPSEWRKQIKLNEQETIPVGRDAVKLWDVKRANKLFKKKLREEQDDIADAILIGYAYIKIANE